MGQPLPSNPPSLSHQLPTSNIAPGQTPLQPTLSTPLSARRAPTEAGIDVDAPIGMKFREDSRGVASIVRWQFARGDRRLTCLVSAAPVTSSYEVATVPMWDVARAAVETFDSPAAALRRHAAIASDLRDAGWTLAAHTA
jgi:hypothetical protein